MTIEIDGIILAAGFSSRAKAFKMELQLDGKSIILHSVETMGEFCSRIIVVAGFQIQKIVELTKGIPNLQVVFNPDYPSGMFSSVKQGVKCVNSRRFFFIPGDYPLVSGPVYKHLLDAADAAPDQQVFIPTFNGRKGHPVLIDSRIKEELLAEPQESDLKRFINRKGFVPVPVDDETILLDIDTMEDFFNAKEWLETHKM